MVENLRRLVAPLAILCELGVLRFEIGAELLGPRKPALSLGVEDQRDVVMGVDHEVNLAPAIPLLVSINASIIITCWFKSRFIPTICDENKTPIAR